MRPHPANPVQDCLLAFHLTTAHFDVFHPELITLPGQENASQCIAYDINAEMLFPSTPLFKSVPPYKLSKMVQIQFFVYNPSLKYYINLIY